MKYHIQGRKKEQPSTKDKAALNVILHDCTKTRGFSRYMGIVFLQLFPNDPWMSHFGLLERSLIPVKQVFSHGKQTSRQGSAKNMKFSMSGSEDMALPQRPHAKAAAGRAYMDIVSPDPAEHLIHRKAGQYGLELLVPL